MIKKALITGVTGQDGFHLTDFLLKKNYKVFGLVRGQKKDQFDKFKKTFPEVEILTGDLADFSSLLNVLKQTEPDELYNLGAISHVGLSFQQPELTADITGLGPLRLLEAVKTLDLTKKTRFYQASSSEMYGKVQKTPQDESTIFYPRSPYGVAKTFAHFSCINYREAYDMHVSSGILFNHEGEHRGYEFVTRKITQSLAKIKLGLIDQFSLGSLAPKRDWGYAGDYVEAMWLMVQQDVSDTFVIATGQTYSVHDFLLKGMAYLGLGEDVERYVKFDNKMIRPSEVDLLKGDSSKAKRILGWQPKTDLDNLVRIMIENDLKIESSA